MGNQRIAVYLDRSPRLVINGQPKELRRGEIHELPGGARVGMDSDGSYLAVAAGDRAGVSITTHSTSLLVRIQSDASLWGKLRGVYGRPDGNPANEWTTAQGIVLELAGDQDAAGFKRLHREFGESWRVKLDTSLFDGERAP